MAGDICYYQLQPSVFKQHGNKQKLLCESNLVALQKSYLFNTAFVSSMWTRNLLINILNHQHFTKTNIPDDYTIIGAKPCPKVSSWRLRNARLWLARFRKRSAATLNSKGFGQNPQMKRLHRANKEETSRHIRLPKKVGSPRQLVTSS